MHEDDPTGGAGLSRSLMVILPIAAVLGAGAGAVWAVFTGEWRAVPAGLALAVAFAGTIRAAMEDGRVQRRIDRMQREEQAERPASVREPDPPGGPGRHTL